MVGACRARYMREVGVVGAVAVAVPAGGQAAAVRIEVHCRRRVEVLAVGDGLGRATRGGG